MIDRNLFELRPESSVGLPSFSYRTLLGLIFTLKDGVTPLMVAVHRGFSRVVKVLMKAKPDVNLKDEVKIA